MFYIVQFSKDGKQFRTVSKCYFDGYSVGDRFLEGCLFEITLDKDSELVVKATPDVSSYLKANNASVEAWENDVLEYLKDGEGHDDCSADIGEAGWDDSELHITNDLDFYLIEEGLIRAESP